MQAADECVPFEAPDEAARQWHAWSAIFPEAARGQCLDCPSDVYAVWNAYFTATGKPRFHWSERDHGLICPIRSLKADPDHEPYEQPIIDAVTKALPRLVPLLSEGPKLLTLRDADVPVDLLHANPAVGCSAGARRKPEAMPGLGAPPACLWLSHNARFGAQLFGKGHEQGRGVDSEYGYDKRDVDGAVLLTPDNPAAITSINLKFYFNWHLVDAVDLCPGNTVPTGGEFDWYRWQQHRALVALSRLEASGMTRDIRVEAEYQRERELLDVPAPSPRPIPVIKFLPTERGVVTGDFLRHRTGPGTAFEAVGMVPFGTELTFDCFSRGTKVNGDIFWCRRADTNTWVSHAYIDDKGSTELPECRRLPGEN